MQEASRFLLFTRRLNELGVRYMVTGSVAAMIYGEPRFTNDVDIVVMMDAAQAERLAEVFPSPEFYCPPLEVIRKETTFVSCWKYLPTRLTEGGTGKDGPRARARGSVGASEERAGVTNTGAGRRDAQLLPGIT
jgi:hypothetical protein